MDSATFAKKIKEKYPQYQSVDDATLVTKIVAKYPQYESQINDLPRKKLGSETGADIKQIGTDIKGSLAERNVKIEENKAAQARGEQGGFRTGMQNLGQVLGFGADVIGDVVKGGVKTILPQKAEEGLKEGISTVVEPIAQSKPVQNLMQKYEQLKITNPKLARDIDATLGLAEFVGTFVGAGAGSATTKATKELGGEVVGQVTKQAGKALTQAGEAVSPFVKSTKAVVKEILPTTESFSSGNISKAFGLTPGDVTNLEKTMGKSLGKWMQEKDVIKGTKAETEAAIGELYDNSYKSVRDEISKVKKVYTENEVPRYKQVLQYLKKESDQIGLEKDAAEIDKLLGKSEFELNDIQRIKELVDDNYNLYTRSGDPAAGRVREGLRNVRSEFREFIEKEVKDNTGADIGALNRDVASAYKLADKAKIRAGRATTANEVTLSDLGTFGVAGMATTPLVGTAALFVKKVMQSPTIRLRIAKMVQKMQPKQKLLIAKELQAGKIPKDFSKFIKIKKGVSKAIDNTGGIAGVGLVNLRPENNDK